jgi:DNA-binding NarL/FixJ family response regulator
MSLSGWTVDELATLRRLAASGYSDVEIARHMKRHPKTVGYRRRVLAIQSAHNTTANAMIARLNKRRLDARATEEARANAQED